MDIKHLKKDKSDGITAARVPQQTLDILKKNNINVSLAIREYLIDLAQQLTRKRLKRVG